MSHTLIILLVMALALALTTPAQGNPGNTAGDINWLQRGVYKTVERNGYGKLRVKDMAQPPVTLGKMRRSKGAKREFAGGVVVEPASRKVLLVRARKEASAGRKGWTWPRARLDPGEDPADAALRQTSEQCGAQAQLVAKIAQLRAGKVLRHYFLMSTMGGGHAISPSETLEVRWVSLKEAKKMLSRRRDRKVLKAAATTMKALEAAAALP